ncbi:MAG: hypothetical protein V5A56_05870 [Halolamina sp.]
MKSNTVERVTDWSSEPFTGGHDGLRELADREFSGAATDSNAWLFMLNGRVLGCFDGEMDSFADADGTAYESPDASLPLLFAMQETGGETRAEYYSEDTPLSEVTKTLESGNFTGYIELSENVLSGDYYVSYYGGRSLPVAFVGNQGERLTGDEAFERADGEVGIYKVNTVELDITDIPDEQPEPPAAGSVHDDETDGAEEPPPAEDDKPAAVNEAEPAEDGGTEEPAAETERPSDTEELATGAEETASDEESKSNGQTSGERTAEAAAEREPTHGADESEPTESRRQSAAEADEPKPTHADRPEPESEPEPEPESEPRPGEPGTAEEQKWRGAKTIPALDPEESVDMAEEVPGGVETETADAATAVTKPRRRAENDAAVEELKEARDRLQARVKELAGQNDELHSETEQLREERDRLEREREKTQAKVAELEAEVEELQTTVDQLESELSRAESELAEVQEYIPEGDHDISEDRAFEGTNLFVRYNRQGGATLEDAHGGDAKRADVNENLRLEHHTDFEEEGAVVDGEPFEEWLHGTIEYGFGHWLVQEFIYEILETGNQSGLGKLFDRIPEIDRIEFQGGVTLPTDEGEPPETATFDVMLRDRMGNPLIVADLNDSREAATESMLGTLIENATPVAKAQESLAGAFFVTTSYYDPGSLETTEDATGGGFLSRDKNKSFVKLSRKSGYHLCLVETRDEEFHVSVPEL